MHIILDVYGGINRSTIGEAAGHWGWFHNQTHFEYSMQVIDAIISFIQNSVLYSRTFEQTADNRNLSVFGTPAALSDKGAAWILKYIPAVLDRVASVNTVFQASTHTE
ncbi:hypothetical protein N7516_009703 [Penicillium verrucosum]|uniref:uncharacterized protein n=1 Tax=Penicillium verrucosum TaxID=60171 RepID=UPI002544E3F7|nr:uncharacterized protein N7516_009703 [Penicillium verrucosum]KAJ5922000.1 hypothetical protein N7516_009703 [Penicillium verrucosum]